MARSTTLGEFRQVELDQGTVRYREIGSGQPLLFVHGLLVNGDLWRNVVQPLSKDFRCIVPDLPLGSHDIPMNPDADLTPPGLARLITDLIAKLEVENVVLVANDTGGALTQLVMATSPTRVGRVVLTSCDAFDNFLPPMFKYLQLMAHLPGSAYMVGQTMRLSPVRRLPMAFGRLTKRPIDDGTMNSYLSPLLSNAAVRRDLTKVLKSISSKYTEDAAIKLANFDHPVLVAWAKEDRIFPFEHGERLASILPNAQLKPVSNSYSFVPEDQPRELAKLIADFARDDIA